MSLTETRDSQLAISEAPDANRSFEREQKESRPLLVVSIHAYQDAALTHRLLNSIKDNLVLLPPKARIALTVVDDSPPDCQDALRNVVKEADHAFSKRADSLPAIRENVSFHYIPLLSHPFLARLINRAREQGLSERRVRYLLSNDMYAGYRGYTGSINQGTLYALYLAGQWGYPMSEAAVIHLDQDEMIKTLVWDEQKITFADVDFFRRRIEEIKQGKQIIGSKYVGHSASPARMLYELSEFIREGLYTMNLKKDPAQPMKRPLAYLTEEGNVNVEFINAQKFLERLPQVINASFNRTPIIGVRTRDIFDVRNRSRDILTAPVSRTIRLDAASTAFDPHRKGMHEVAWYFAARANLDSDTGIVRVEPHLHYRSPNLGNHLQGKNLLNALYPKGIKETFAIAELSDDAVNKHFSDDEKKKVYMVREHMRALTGSTKAEEVHQAMTNFEEIEVLVSKMKLTDGWWRDKRYNFTFEVLDQLIQQFKETRKPLLDALETTFDEMEVINDVKRYLRAERYWKILCELAYDEGRKLRESAEEGVFIPDNQPIIKNSQSNLRLYKDTHGAPWIQKTGSPQQDLAESMRFDLPQRGYLFSALARDIPGAPIIPRQVVFYQRRSAIAYQTCVDHVTLKHALNQGVQINFSNEALQELYMLTVLSLLFHSPDIGEHNIGLYGDQAEETLSIAHTVFVDLNESFPGDSQCKKGVIHPVTSDELLCGLRPSSHDSRRVASRGLFSIPGVLGQHFNLRMDARTLLGTYQVAREALISNGGVVQELFSGITLYNGIGEDITKKIYNDLYYTRLTENWFVSQLERQQDIRVDGVAIIGTDSLDQAYKLGLAIRMLMQDGRFDPRRITWIRK